MTPHSGRAILRQAFRHLEHEVPGKVAYVLRNLRHPNARWIRIPVGILLMLGGIFSILPFLGLWMLPLGLLLIAYDVPFLQKPFPPDELVERVQEILALRAQNPR